MPDQNLGNAFPGLHEFGQPADQNRPRVVLVSATRVSHNEFVKSARLAQSLRRVATHWPVRLRLFADNSRPLPECYNQALDESSDNDLLVFVHDDVYLDDWMLGQRIHEALQQFDVVGIAGNEVRQPGQLAWHLLPATPRDGGVLSLDGSDSHHIFGSVAHGDPMRSVVRFYGPVPQALEVLDGVLIAVKASTLKRSGVRFDPCFEFHFYDLDFCRAACQAGLHLGAWPIAVTHASLGESIQSSAWQIAAQRYLDKWGSQ